MYCCLLEIRIAKLQLSDIDVKQMWDAISIQFSSEDEFIILEDRMIMLTSLKNFSDIKDKICYIQKDFSSKYGPFISLNCGIAEVKDKRILQAIGCAKQMLSRTNLNKPVVGMYYCKFNQLF